MPNCFSRPSIKVDTVTDLYGICWIYLAVRRDCWFQTCSKLAPLPYETSRRCKMQNVATKTGPFGEASVHEHIARAVYYLSVHLLFASLVAALAWALTSALRASATTKYWIWV